MNQIGDVCGFGVIGSGFAFPGIWENNIFRDVDARGRKIETTRITAVDDPLSSNQFVLNENYPNPFRSTTRIEYNLSRQSTVRFEIYDLLGKPVKTLIDSKKPAGNHSQEWDGSDNLGKHLPGGVYLYRMEADNSFGRPLVKTHKMILIR